MIVRKFQQNLLLVLFIGSAFMSCKKGDNDPVFTLQTRKARMANEWTVSFSEIKMGDSLIAFDGEKEIISFGDVEIASIPSTKSYTFEKNGNYTIEISKTYPAGFLDSALGTQTINTLETGVWSFTGGNGDVKNKEQVLLLPNRWERRTEGFAEVEVKTWEGQTQGQVFNIDMLKSKEMRWIYALSSNTPLGVVEGGGTIEFQ